MSDTTRYGIRANGKHSFEDYGVMLSKKPELTTPQPKRVTREVPYCSVLYDASLAFDRPFFGSRTLTCDWEIMAEDTDELERLKSELVTWLLGINDNCQIEYDDIPGWYFTGATESVTETYDEEDNLVTVEAVFRLQPFRSATSKTRTYFADSDVSFTVGGTEPVAATLMYLGGDTAGSRDFVLDGTSTYLVTLNSPVTAQIEPGTHTIRSSIGTGSNAIEYRDVAI